jgi:antitoxin Phd
MSVLKLDASEARQEFADTLNRVAYGKERVILHRRGKPIAVLVPIEDYELLEQLEDDVDVADARRILADPEESPEPWEKVKADLGL